MTPDRDPIPIPLSGEPVYLETGHADFPANAGESVRVLCVDDDEFALAYYLTVLREAGYTVKICESGSQCLAILNTEQFDLLLLDIEMPGMNGLEVLHRLRRHAQHSSLPVIIVSSDDNEHTVVQGLTMGADDYLVKPVSAGEMLGKVSVALRKRRLATLSASGIPFGTLLGQRYEIISTLGKGGFTTVYLGRDRTTDPPTKVAIKVFSPEQSAGSRFMARFLREAYAHCRLSHPNIVTFHGVGQAETVHYLVMEYLQGQNLDEICNATGPLPPSTVALLALDLLSALAYLDQHGLVHRDIKPHNIMITEEGVTKLLDFGLARTITDQTLSTESTLVGTPLFLSPEFIRAVDHLDIRSDIYSLGVTLYYLLTCRSPFPDASQMELMHHHLSTPPLPIHMAMPELSPALARLVDSMLVKSRDKRPTPAELLKAFSAIAADDLAQ